MSDLGNYTPDERPIFYSLAERRNLIALLTAGAQRSQRSGRHFNKNYPLHRSRTREEALLERRVFALDCAARDTLAEFTEFRGGKLDQIIKLRDKLPGLVSRLERLVSELRPALENYGPSLHEDAQKLLSRVRSAAQFYERCHEKTLGGIASEGEHDSHNLASACLNQFLVVVCVTWFQGTYKRVAAGSWKGPFGRFAEAAVAPFASAINTNAGRFLISPDWPNLAERIASREIQNHEFLTPPSDERPVLKYKSHQRVIRGSPRQRKSNGK